MGCGTSSQDVGTQCDMHLSPVQYDKYDNIVHAGVPAGVDTLEPTKQHSLDVTNPLSFSISTPSHPHFIMYEPAAASREATMDGASLHTQLTATLRDLTVSEEHTSGYASSHNTKNAASMGTYPSRFGMHARRRSSSRKPPLAGTASAPPSVMSGAAPPPQLPPLPLPLPSVPAIGAIDNADSQSVRNCDSTAFGRTEESQSVFGAHRGSVRDSMSIAESRGFGRRMLSSVCIVNEEGEMESSCSTEIGALIGQPSSGPKKLKPPPRGSLCHAPQDNAVGDLVHAAVVSFETTLDLDSCGLKTLPQSLMELEDVLEQLVLSNNQLTELPAFVGNFINLERLSVSSNLLTVFPEAACALPGIDHFDLSHNSLSTVPVAVENMVSLRELNLDYNCFVTFPVAALKAMNMEVIYLAENHYLQTLPSLEEIQMAPRLKQIIVDNHPNLTAMVKPAHGRLHSKAHLFTWNQIYGDKILDGLYLGGLRSAQTRLIYDTLGIKAVVTCGRKMRVNTEGIEHLSIQVEDLEEQSMQPYFEQVSAFIAEQIQRGAVLVHCFAGLSRSATMVTAYLMSHRGMRLDDAIAHVIAARPAVHPNPGFVRELVAYDKRLFPNARPLDMTNLGKERTERLLAERRMKLATTPPVSSASLVTPPVPLPHSTT